MGIPFDDVLEKVQSGADNSAVSRLHLVTKQDLKNIVRDFNLSRGVRVCANDADSVAAWVEQNRQDGDRSLVRYIKFQGSVDEQRDLAADDFMLVIMTEAQIAVLKQLYKPNHEVAMDSTHGTNAYDYQLTTLMIIDEHGEGFPAAFCFSNKVDEVAMSVFLSVCKENIGWPLEDAVFMSDDAAAYYNAWTHVMGQPAHRLLCTWHIDRAWRKNLARVKGDSLLKATIYKTLRALLEITDKQLFSLKLSEFLQASTEDARTAEFGEYFTKEYAARPELWACCHRLGLKVHHNMHLEAMHRVLKHVYMSGRKVRRMDSCIHALLRLMRMKMHDRLLKVHKGKWTRHVFGIRSRHRKGLSCEARSITVIETNKVYAVQGKNKDTVYMVEQSDVVPHDSLLCPLSCHSCSICIHTFMCNCVDFGLRNTICKHIHAVVSICKPAITCTPQCSEQERSTEVMQVTASVEDECEEDECESVAADDMFVSAEEVVSVTTRSVQLNPTSVILQSLSSKTSENAVQHYIDIAESHWSCIRAQMGANVEVASAVCEQLVRVKALISALKCKPQLCQVLDEHEPANKKAVQQRHFVSTKKKPKRRKVEAALSKPDEREKAFLLDSLSGNVEVVFTSAAETDHDYHVGSGDRIAFEHSY